MKKSILIALLLSTANVGCATFRPDHSVDVFVVDEMGKPIPQAQVRCAFGDGAQGKGLTDQEGKFSFTGNVGTGRFGAIVEKSGYYKSSGNLWSGGLTKLDKAEAKGLAYYPATMVGLKEGWVMLKPPSEFTIELRQIIEPVPMHHKRVSLSFPVLGKPIGYDLSKGDWVAPYGDGKNADLYFEAIRDVRSDHDFDSNFKVTFPQPEDGFITFEQEIVGPPFSSEMVGPQIAPLSGYQSSIEREINHRPGESSHPTTNPSKHYILRVRTKVNENGEVIEATHARIEGDFGFSPATRRDAPEVSFIYFFNPDLDPDNRSLEYEGENLLEGYNSRGQPKRPWE